MPEIPQRRKFILTSKSLIFFFFAFPGVIYLFSYTFLINLLFVIFCYFIGGEKNDLSGM